MKRIQIIKYSLLLLMVSGCGLIEPPYYNSYDYSTYAYGSSGYEDSEDCPDEREELEPEEVVSPSPYWGEDENSRAVTIDREQLIDARDEQLQQVVIVDYSEDVEEYEDEKVAEFLQSPRSQVDSRPRSLTKNSQSLEQYLTELYQGVIRSKEQYLEPEDKRDDYGHCQEILVIDEVGEVQEKLVCAKHEEKATSVRTSF